MQSHLLGFSVTMSVLDSSPGRLHDGKTLWLPKLLQVQEGDHLEQSYHHFPGDSLQHFEQLLASDQQEAHPPRQVGDDGDPGTRLHLEVAAQDL